MRRRLLITGVVAATVVVLVLVYLTASTIGRGPDTAAPSAQPSASAVETPPAEPTATPTGPAGAAPSSTRSTPPRPTTTTTTQPGIPASLRGKDIEVIPTSQPIVALTFDAGGNADGLAAILQTLASERVPATFFLTGSWAKRYPSGVRSIVAAGHRLGNHSSTHPYLTQLTDDQIRAEVTQGNRDLLANGGTDTRPLFRFPYGDRNTRTIAAVNSAGYVAVRWTVDTLGWKGTGAGITVQQVVDRALGAARPGEIVLMHVGSHPEDHSTLDAQALPTVIAKLKAKGYRFVTLDALLH
jgi:peptidoglycan/xylan/chitin deacetylase (PgdA/CDA1 family)